VLHCMLSEPETEVEPPSWYTPYRPDTQRRRDKSVTT
jgi:hypothetical protein